MKRQELYTIATVCEKALVTKWPNNVTPARVYFAISKTKNKIIKELREMEATFKQDNDFIVFEKARHELMKAHSKKDDKKCPIILNKILNGRPVQEYDIEDMDLYNTALEALRTEHKEAIEKQESKDTAFNDLLDTDIESHFVHKIFNQDIPQETPVEVLKVFDLLPEMVSELALV